MKANRIEPEPEYGVRYVVGFLFPAGEPEGDDGQDEYDLDEEDSVVMIRKTKPEWQKGRLNGVGGKIEPDETPEEAMCREFAEETGLHCIGWREFALMIGNDWCCHVFYTRSSAWHECKSTTEEQVEFVRIHDLDSEDTISNVPWLVRMAMNAIDSDNEFHSVITYK